MKNRTEEIVMAIIGLPIGIAMGYFGITLGCEYGGESPAIAAAYTALTMLGVLVLSGSILMLIEDNV